MAEKKSSSQRAAIGKRKGKAVSGQQSGVSKGKGKNKSESKSKGTGESTTPSLMRESELCAGGNVSQDGGERAETDAASEEKAGDKKYGPPSKTYREALPMIADSLAEQAKAGSYLHARALKEMVEAEALRKSGARRKERGFAQLLLEKIREMEIRSVQ